MKCCWSLGEELDWTDLGRDSKKGLACSWVKDWVKGLTGSWGRDWVRGLACSLRKGCGRDWMRD